MSHQETLQQKIAQLEQRNAQLEQENKHLRERVEWLGAFFERAPVGFVLESKGGWVIESNPRAQEILGYRGEELRGMAFTEFSHPDDLPHELQLFEQLLTGVCKSYVNDKRYICRDGQIFYGRVHVSFLREPGQSSQPVVIGIIEEVGEQQ
jgi:PAS domain S-box-containing protein